MIVPVARMSIHHYMLIPNLLSVYSTGYGIGTVFPFGLIYRVTINYTHVYDGFRLDLRTD